MPTDITTADDKARGHRRFDCGSVIVIQTVCPGCRGKGKTAARGFGMEKCYRCSGIGIVAFSEQKKKPAFALTG